MKNKNKQKSHIIINNQSAPCSCSYPTMPAIPDG